MAGRCAVLPVLVALACSGCGTITPIGEPTLDVEATQARAAELDRFPIDRGGVHALLGAPWIASDAFGVEVYRLQGKQRNLLVVFAPYPVPVPFPSDKLEVYTLVAYGPDGNVTARASDYARAAAGQSPTLILRAGEFQFMHAVRDSLTVSLSHYRQVRSSHPTPNPTCTLLLDPDPTRLAASRADGFCTSGVNVYVDNADRRSLLLTFPAVIPPDRTSETACRSAGGSFVVFAADRGGACVFNTRSLYPLTLPTGRHALRFAVSRWDDGVVREVACTVDQTALATLIGKFVLCMHHDNGRMVRDLPDEETVVLGEIASDAEATLPVVIYDNGTWLYPP